MKKLTTLLITLLISISSFAQTGINYKAIIKDGSGNVVASQPVTVQFIIYKGAALTNNVYQESHPTNTDANGIAIVNIGKGTTSDVFTDIDWGSDEHWLNVKVDIGSGLEDMGTTQFMAVPYALQAESLTSGAIKLDDLQDAKSDNNGSSIFVGLDSGLNDDGTNSNVAIGYKTLESNINGKNNVAIGYQSLKSNITGEHNIAIGRNALFNNISGEGNTAFGTTALLLNTTGNHNTATGNYALFSNEAADNNTATGYYALYANITGYSNTANGIYALVRNTIGSLNTANGAYALDSNVSGNSNTATGYKALYTNSSGNYNTANGNNSLRSNTTGGYNTATGNEALYRNTFGELNVANGNLALYSNTTGDRNTAVGYRALFNNISGSNNIAIGNNADVPSVSSSNQVRIGNTAISYAGIQVAWTVTSDKRWKDNIRELPYGLDLVKQLQPVDYSRKNNENKTREMGFIAQDLEALLAKVGYIDQGFLTKDDNGYLSVRYNDLIALLTKAIQEQQTIIETQNSKIEAQAVETAHQSASIESLILRMNALEIANN